MEPRISQKTYNIRGDEPEGMMVDDDAPQVKIGEYTICVLDEKSIAIYVDDGEGGQFSLDEFEEAVDKFFRANF